MIQPIELGKFRLYSLYDGTFRLDGGAMFGVVPWALWSRYAPPDELNRIRLGLRPLLVEAGDQWILIDTGMGDKFNEKLNKIYSIESKPQLVEQLNQIGVAVTDINIVINTHLHWDHAGGNTKREPSSDKWIPAFPNARYIVQQGEFEFATHPNERTRGSYRAEDFIALRDLGYFDFVDGNVGIANGVTVVRSGGHVPYHQCVLLESGKTKAFFLGDLIPTHAHLPLPYITGYDVEPLVTLARKKEYLSQAEKENWLLFFEHDPQVSSARIKLENGSYRIKSPESIGGQF